MQRDYVSISKNQALHRTLEQLASDPCIKVCKFDKGKGTVILDAEDYCFKLDVIIEDKTKFEVVKIEGNHPLISKESL